MVYLEFSESKEGQMIVTARCTCSLWLNTALDRVMRRLPAKCCCNFEERRR